MKVCLRISGEQLLSRVTAEIARTASAFPRQFMPNVPLQWQIEALHHPLSHAALESLPAQATIVLVEAGDTQVIDELWSIASRDYHAIAQHQQPAASDDAELAPIILVLERELPTSRLLEMPPVVSDWVNGLDAMHDLARRVHAALKRRPQKAIEPGGAKLSLLAESRLLCHGPDSVLLTPSEVAVAELFLAHFGSMIPFEQIQLLFRLAGRSTEGSNVRVTMFQLRFKIEALTHCRYTLSSAYGHGYVLRHGKAGEPRAEPARRDTRLPAH